jgi:hypothetical protein
LQRAYRPPRRTDRKRRHADAPPLGVRRRRGSVGGSVVCPLKKKYTPSPTRMPLRRPGVCCLTGCRSNGCCVSVKR